MRILQEFPVSPDARALRVLRHAEEGREPGGPGETLGDRGDRGDRRGVSASDQVAGLDTVIERP